MFLLIGRILFLFKWLIASHSPNTLTWHYNLSDWLEWDDQTMGTFAVILKKKGKTKKSYFTILTFPCLAPLTTRWSTNEKRKIRGKIYDMTDSLRPHNLFWLFATHNVLLATVLYLSVSQALRQWVKWNEWDRESLGDSSWHANSLSLTLT